MKARILLVDDDPMLLAGLKRQLRREFQVVTASGGPEALALVNANGPFSVVVSDFRMPGMNGIELLSRVKDLNPDTVRMMLTGSTDLSTAVQAVNEGNIFQFHLKPCPSLTLARAIHEGIEKYSRKARRTSHLKAFRKSIAQASEIQRNLMPKDRLEIEGMQIAGRSDWCDETGGDYYDFFTRGGKDKSCVGIVVGDVTGHGLPSALLMTTARGFMRERIVNNGNTAEIVTDVNRHLVRDVDGTHRFMSMFYCEVDPLDHILRWTRAGHDPAFIYDPASETFDELAGPGMPLPLGVLEETRYQESVRAVAPGQIIVIGTDGIWETRNAKGEYFGKNRLMTIVGKYAGRPPHAIVAAVLEQLNIFRGVLPVEDDATLVVVKMDA
ncbi:MAG: SpoIIE family protein phosphatase [Desulfosarcina sp.]|nr:SpoIIE family protein phosphatase [Desulfobacterales bacterium]